MLGRGSVGKELDDKVFIIADRAKNAVHKYGRDNVINGTIGALYDEEEKLVNFQTVVETYKNLSSEDIFAYASGIEGTFEYKEAVKRIILGETYKKTYKNHFIDVVATPGGTGAIRNSLKNYLNPGEKILLPNLMWSPYKLMAEEVGGSYETYEIFDKNNEFNLAAFKIKVLELMEIQENVVIMINDPCHNPTGYSLTIKEWKDILNFLEECSKLKNIILLNDIAYMDFSQRNLKDYRDLFKNLSENLLVIFLFSMSKSFTGYGLRAGAQLAISTNENIIEEFRKANKFSCRATWSNISRGAMTLLSRIVLEEKKYEELLREREGYKKLLRERADIFLKEAKEIDLEIYPYRDGFFVTIPVKNNIEKTVKKLEEKNIYTVVLAKEIRIGLCSIPKKKIYGLCKKIKECL